jgi:hypothetical protein
MTPSLSRLNLLHIATMGLWAGMLAMSGVSAALIFPMMKRLDPALPEFAAYTGDHWMIAAGMIAARQFSLLAWAESVLALIAVGSLMGLVASTRGGLSHGLVLRCVAVGGATAVLLYQSFVLQTRMDGHMLAHWNAARAGDNEAALTHKDAFTADHPLASGLMQARLGLLLAGLAAGVWSLRTGGTRGGSAESPGAQG